MSIEKKRPMKSSDVVLKLGVEATLDLVGDKIAEICKESKIELRVTQKKDLYGEKSRTFLLSIKEDERAELELALNTAANDTLRYKAVELFYPHIDNIDLEKINTQMVSIFIVVASEYKNRTNTLMYTLIL